jgi:tetratricopeptide (TPR) repeat protein
MKLNELVAAIAVWAILASSVRAGPAEDFDAAYAALQRHDLPQAIELFTRVLADPDLPADKRPAALLDRGLAYSASGDQAHAIEDYTAALPLAASLESPVAANMRWAVYLNRGNAFAALGKTQEALADYTAALDRKPDLVMALVNRGGVYLGLGKLAEARADEDRAIQAQPDNPGAFFIRGLVRRRQGDDEGAISDLDVAINAQPSAIAYLERSAAKFHLGRIDQALEDADRSIAMKPDFVDARHSRGELRASVGGYAGALEDLNEAVRLAPNDALVRRDRGAVYFNEGDFAAAVADFDQSLQLAPTDAYALIWRHLAKARLKQDDAAELAAGAAKIDRTAWPAPVVALLLGQSKAEDVQAAVARAAPADRQGQACEASYYLGEAALLAGAQPEASKHLQSAADSCPLIYMERSAAAAELRRMAR